jgi:ABC-type spermidine/putrescine transport system permease subunit II
MSVAAGLVVLFLYIPVVVIAVQSFNASTVISFPAFRSTLGPHSGMAML